MTDAQLEIGTRVLVTKPGNDFLTEEEAGVVLEVGCTYQVRAVMEEGDNNGNVTLTHTDGIMVKLQISNTRGIFPPHQVTRLEFSETHSPIPVSKQPRSRLRRSRGVTPSPSVLAIGREETAPATVSAMATATATAMATATATAKKSNSRKRGSTEDAATQKVEEGPKTKDSTIATKHKKSKYFGKEELEDENGITSRNITLFRVQRAPSASSKCQQCGECIAKHLLRVQPTSQKRGWYHGVCAKEAFGMASSSTSSSSTSRRLEDTVTEGLEELTAAEQRLLMDQWSIENPDVPTSTVVKMEVVSEVEGDAEDPPIATFKKRPVAVAAKTGSKKKKAPAKSKRAKVKKEEEDLPMEDGMLRSSDIDSDDEKDMPFRIEYSATGRATCRGCDERIAKGLLRVAERPLFRGKPGFTVYRHLDCTIFADHIQSLEDVGGWRRLRQADRTLVSARVEKSKVLVEKENQEIQPDELVQVVFQGETRKPPPGLSAILLPFQVEGTSWMVHQEKHIPEIRGGILADEMGMGKTIQTIATMLDNRPKLQHAKPGAKHPPSSPDLKDRKREEKLWKDSLDAWKFEMDKSNVPKKLITQKPGKKVAPMGARSGTLVVCPVIALYQWREEIKKFTDDNTFSICCYHGPNRAKEFPRELLCKYDVVLTTYQVIESDFRKMVSPNKVKCPNCGGSYKIDKLRVHLKYFCGESAQRTEAQSRQYRSVDRGGGGGNGRIGSGGGGAKNKKKKHFQSNSSRTKKKTSMMKTVSKTQSVVATKSKKTVRARKTKGYDSDSDLSVAEDLDLHSPRPRRSAAASASQKMTASAKKWGTADASDSDNFSDDGSSSGDDDSLVEADSNTKKIDRQNQRIKLADSEADSQSSESDSSEDEEAVARAMKKQKLALTRAKASKTKGKGAMKKSFGKGKGKKLAPDKGKKKPLPDDSDDSSSDDEVSENMADRDPLEGIDLEKLMQEAMDGSRVSVLHTLCWWRVVLDEAHMIKSRSSQTAAAAFALTSIHRWCLSGTPLQNRVGELYSLIRFLRIDPMAHYFCRKDGCDCKSVHYRMMHGKCMDCGHGTVQHFSHFNKHVLNPIQRSGYQGDGRRAMMKLKTDVLDKSLLRRTKQTRAEDLNLPPRVVNIRTIRLHPIEEDFYNALYTQTKSSFDDYVTEGTLLNNYAHIFDLLTKMRQAVDHPYLIVYSKKNAGKFSVPGTPAVSNGSVDCDLCHEPPTDRIVSSCCGSAFCRSCVVDYMSPALENLRQEGTRCPCCRDPFSVDLNQASSDVVDDGTLTLSTGTGSATAGMPSLKEMSHVSSGSILRRINLAEFATSTKVDALVQELIQMRQQRPGSKALVFSQFVNMLDLIRWRLHSDPCLHDLGLGVRIIHGGMNIQSRDSALKDFREDSSVRILLMSLKAGGVALNLTVANEAYLMDPWWNPAAEMQAIDRTHRLGQHRPIRAVRFIAEGTVEERVLQLQEKKRLVFDGTVGRDAASLKMLTVEDMKAMFA